ncbi:MAG: hypothetical protein ACYTDY_01625 [Planctomycetota bacterium]|jgi:hypothetical protein
MRLPTGTILVLSFCLASGLVLAADENPTVGELTGDATYLPGGKGEPKPLAKGDVLKQGDDVTLAPGATMKVALPAGASMEVTGPANFRLRMISDYAWTIELLSGTIDHLVAKDYFTGVTTPAGVFMALRNGDVTVKVDSSDGAQTVAMTLNEGTEAKIVEKDGEARKLVKGEPFVFRSEGEEPAGEDAEAREDEEEVGEAEEEARPKRPTMGAQIVIGRHVVRVVPKDEFRIAPTPTGGWVLYCISPEGEYAQVTIDGDINFFMTNGDEIEFDSEGNIIRHDAIVHVYAALDVRGIYDEAVANPNDASFVGNTSE